MNYNNIAKELLIPSATCTRENGYPKISTEPEDVRHLKDVTLTCAYRKKKIQVDHMTPAQIYEMIKNGENIVIPPIGTLLEIIRLMLIDGIPIDSEQLLLMFSYPIVKDIDLRVAFELSYYDDKKDRNHSRVKNWIKKYGIEIPLRNLRVRSRYDRFFILTRFYCLDALKGIDDAMLILAYSKKYHMISRIFHDMTSFEIYYLKTYPDIFEDIARIISVKGNTVYKGLGANYRNFYTYFWEYFALLFRKDVSTLKQDDIIGMDDAQITNLLIKYRDDEIESVFGKFNYKELGYHKTRYDMLHMFAKILLNRRPLKNI